MTNRCKSSVLHLSKTVWSKTALGGLILLLGMSLLAAPQLWAAPLAQGGGGGGGGGGGPHKGYTAYTDMCAKCHRAHTADRNNLLISGGGGGGLAQETTEGKYDIPQTNLFCYTCHNGTGASTAKPISTHGNRNFEKREGNVFQLECTVCHDPHGSDNIFAIKSYLPLAPDVTVGPITFLAETGPNSFDDGVSPGNARLCVACHEAVGGMKHTGGAGHEGNFDFSGENCLECHPHSADGLQESSDGFMLVDNVRELLIARAQVDLQVEQNISPAQLVAGVPFTYTLMVSNHGPQDAWGVVLTDTLPAGVELLSIHPPEGAQCEGTDILRCELGDIEHGDSITLTLAALPQPDLLGTLSNLVEVRALQADPAPADNSLISEDTIISHADLSIRQTSMPESLLAGEPLTYTLTIANNGPSWATGVKVQDILPAGVAFQAATTSQGQCAEVDGVLGCELGTLEVDHEATVVVQTRALLVNATISNEATVTADGFDPNPDNNLSQSQNEIIWAADLTVTQTAQPSPVETGEMITYTLTVYNKGPLDAPAVILTDTLPADAGLAALSTTQGKCDTEGGQVRCELGELAVGAQAQVTLSMQAPTTSGEMVNQAGVRAESFDPVPQDNTSILKVAVHDGPDLAVSVVAEKEVVFAGDEQKYIITVLNNGPSPGKEVILVDTLPQQGTLTYAAASQGPCYENNGKVTCEIGDLQVGQQAIVTIVVIAPENDPAPLQNEAEVIVQQVDPDLSNNHISTSSPVVLQADLLMTMDGFPATVGLDESLTYTLTVTNQGPSRASNIMVVDTLPDALQIDSVTTSRGECEEKSGEVRCSVAAMDKDESMIVVIRSHLVEEVETLENRAQVEAETYDPQGENNSSKIVTNVEISTPTPTVTPTPTPAPTSTITPTATTTPSPTPTSTPVSTPTSSPTPPPTPSPTPNPTPTTTPTPTSTPTPSPAPTPTPTPTPSSTPTPTPAPSPSPTPTPTPTVSKRIQQALRQI